MSHAVRVLLIERNDKDAQFIKLLLSQDDGRQYNVAIVDSISAACSLAGEQRCQIILLSAGAHREGDAGLSLLVEPFACPIIVIGTACDQNRAMLKNSEGVCDYLIRSELCTLVLSKVIEFSMEKQKLMEKLQFAEQREEFLATHDVLTGLPNRTTLHERISNEINYSQRYQRNFAVGVLGIDRFKTINECLGHAIGDKLLQQVARRVAGVLRKSDIMARVSGNELVFLLPQIQQNHHAAKVAQTVLQTFDSLYAVDGHDLFITASLGLALYPNDGARVSDLYQNAQAAMHSAKQVRGNSFEYYRKDLNIQAKLRLTLEKELRYAIDRDEFFLHYQPLVNASNAKMIGAEALIRWQHPDKGIVLPGEFIDVTESTGLIVDIGQGVLYQACLQNRAWQDAGYDPIRISVNLSAKQFEEAGLIDTVKSILKDTGLDANWLELELTERVVMNNVKYTLETLNELKAMGVRLSIDDFGTGYSSLSYLKQFPIDALKVDRSFICDMDGGGRHQAIVQAIIAMANNLTIETVAEGIETQQQFSMLQKLGCHYMQGFWFQKPIEATMIAALFGQRPLPLANQANG